MKHGRIRTGGALLLALLLTLGCLPALSLAQDIAPAQTASPADLYDDGEPIIVSDPWPEMDAFIADYLANYDTLQFGEEMAIRALEYIGGKIGDKIEEKAWSNIWDTILGADNSQSEMRKALDRIEAQLQQIIDMLEQLIHDEKLRDVKDSIQRKLTLTRAIKVPLDNRGREFNSAKTNKQRFAVLDEWYKGTRVGEQANAIDALSYYVHMITNDDGLNQDGDYFPQYDKYAYLKWDWEVEGVPFRAVQRQKDIVTVAKMAALNALWLAKEKEVHPDNMEVLLEKEKILKESVATFLSYCRKNTVQYDPNYTDFHPLGKHKFNMYIGPQKAVGNFRIPFMTLQERSSSVLTSAATLLQLRHINPTKGTHGVIYKEEMKLLWKYAQAEKLSLKEYLKKHTHLAVGDALGFVLMGNGVRNPMIFGDCGRGYRMYIDLFNANSTTDWDEGVNSRAADINPMPYVPTMYRNTSDAGRYRVVFRDGDQTGYFATTPFQTIWMRAGDDMEGEIEVEAPCYEDMAPVVTLSTLHAVADGMLETYIEDMGYLFRVPYDAGTAFTGLDGNAIDPMDAIGSQVKVTTVMTGPAEDILWNDTATTGAGGEEILCTVDAPLYAQSVQVLSDAPRAEMSGVVTYIEADGAAISVAIPGGTAAFAVPGGLLPDGLVVGAEVRVTYHEASGVHTADHIEIIWTPEPETFTVEGIVDSVDIREEILGRPPLVSIAQPGGVTGVYVDMRLLAEVERGVGVRVAYHVADGLNVADSLQITARPAPDPVRGTAEGPVVSVDVAGEIIGALPQVTVGQPGGTVAVRVPLQAMDGVEEGAQVRILYYEADGELVAEHVDVLRAPQPVEDPDTPIDPVDNPTEQGWVEGCLTQVLTDPDLLMPGQARSVEVDAAGQGYTLLVPQDMYLYADVKAGAFVHADYVVDAAGQQVLQTLIVLAPAPAEDDMLIDNPVVLPDEN